MSCALRLRTLLQGCPADLRVLNGPSVLSCAFLQNNDALTDFAMNFMNLASVGDNFEILVSTMVAQ